jgi:hypothetical protein
MRCAVIAWERHSISLLTGKAIALIVARIYFHAPHVKTDAIGTLKNAAVTGSKTVPNKKSRKE